MTKKKFLSLCCIVNSLFIVVQIYKHAQSVHYAYKKQQKELSLEQGKEALAMLQQKLCALQDSAAIKEFAQTKLGMKLIKLHTIKRLNL